VPLADDLPPL